VAADIVMPRFRRLAEGDVSEKEPGELVTVADVEAEQAITSALLAWTPGALVIGEEAVAADPGLLDAARTADDVWVIDPIDGTAQFVAGLPDFALMVARIRCGVATESWIFQPAHGRMFTAERNGGAWLDGVRIIRSLAPPEPGAMHGVALTRLMDPATGAAVIERLRVVGNLSKPGPPAGINYPLVALGGLDFVVCWRTSVWDHAPGALLLEEAGGRTARLDGSAYEPWSDRTGLVFAADPATHQRIAALIAPSGMI
jgi:fructose-1,6-bisphosphatase/inositol monophosphatase family enzyme